MTQLEELTAEYESLKAQLAAIGHVESYGINGKNINYRKHKELTDRKDRLFTLINRLNGTSQSLTNVVFSSK